MQRSRGKEGDVSNYKTRIVDDRQKIKPPNGSNLRGIVRSNLEGSLVVGLKYGWLVRRVQCWVAKMVLLTNGPKSV